MPDHRIGVTHDIYDELYDIAYDTAYDVVCDVSLLEYTKLT